MISATDEIKSQKDPDEFQAVADVQNDVRAAQAVLKDVRFVFAERAKANKAEKAAAAGTAAPKRVAKAKATVSK